MEVEVFKGYWLSTNQFRTDDGKLIHVCPYNYIYNLYVDKLPMFCYINIAKPDDVIIDVFEIE